MCRGPVPRRRLGHRSASTTCAGRSGTRPAANPAAWRRPAAASGCVTTCPAGDAQKIQRSRYALWKNPEDLTENQKAKLAWIATASPTLHRAYLLKEGLRYVFKVGGDDGIDALNHWLVWAQRCQIETFVFLARKIRRHLPAIHASLREQMSNAIVESFNTKIRLLTRIAFGFHGPQPLIALAMLTLGGYRPHLPGRT